MKAVLFPGQGAQRVGMGGALFERFADLTRTADQVLGYSIRQLCMEGPLDRLTLTQFTQPALYVVNALRYLVRREEGCKPDYLMGHSVFVLCPPGDLPFQKRVFDALLNGASPARPNPARNAAPTAAPKTAARHRSTPCPSPTAARVIGDLEWTGGVWCGTEVHAEALRRREGCGGEVGSTEVAGVFRLACLKARAPSGKTAEPPSRMREGLGVGLTSFRPRRALAGSRHRDQPAGRRWRCPRRWTPNGFRHDSGSNWHDVRAKRAAGGGNKPVARRSCGHRQGRPRS